MKIVSFTMVNNESEIIESFVRYNYNFVDEMVIVDNGCTDSTIKILQNLITEGYKITIFDESLEAYNQFRLDNKYLSIIIDKMSPDIILPLDADEFLTGDSNPRTILEQLDLNKIYYINWQWFVMTKDDDQNEMFIPKRMKYCLDRPAWNYSDKKPVTKTIIPAKYYKKMKLTLSMGHHTVFGNERAEIEHLTTIWLAHYRAISVEQLIYKTCCYTIRDIATMENNFETAQRTNHMAMIEDGLDMWRAAEDASYGGYDRNIVCNPINLSYSTKASIVIKYGNYSKESLSQRLLYTGREMAVRAYNAERTKKEKAFIQPIILCLDGLRGEECVFPNPSNRLTILTEMYNVRGLVTTSEKIKFLKANYRLIVTPDFVKFLPHSYIVIPETLDVDSTKKELVEKGLDANLIISIKEYRRKLGVIRSIYCYIRFVPSMCKRVYAYISRNGIGGTVRKIKERLR